jgi:hypothetical protein
MIHIRAKETQTMKRLIYLIPIFALIAALGVGNVYAQTDPYPAELEYYDAQIAVLLPRLDDFQYQYHVTNGRYFQALQSHSSAPEVPTVPDGIEASPTDQPEALAYFWSTFAELPDLLAWSFRIDTYSGPLGDGYVLTVETVVNGQTWTRAINYGPDAWRNAEWYPVAIEE